MKRLLLVLAFVCAPAWAEPEPYRGEPIMVYRVQQVPGPFKPDLPIDDPGYSEWFLQGTGDLDACAQNIFIERFSLNPSEFPFEVHPKGKCISMFSTLIDQHNTWKDTYPTHGGNFIQVFGYRIVPEPDGLALIGLGLLGLALRHSSRIGAGNTRITILEPPA